MTSPEDKDALEIVAVAATTALVYLGVLCLVIKLARLTLKKISN